MFVGEIRNRATSTKTTVIDVFKDRASDWMMLKLTFCSKVRRLACRRFSRIRSKMTIVSWTEKPMTVRAAVTKSVLISPSGELNTLPRIDQMPVRTNTSCNSARMAAMANLQLKGMLREVTI